VVLQNLVVAAALADLKHLVVFLYLSQHHTP
jgi:hypothetical protein